MPIESAPPTDLNRLLRQLLDGDLTAIRGVLDELHELPDRLDDWRWLRERVGVLAVENYVSFFGDESTQNRNKKHRVEADPEHALAEKSWQAFVRDVVARFWFDLYEFDSTVSSLSEGWKRTRQFGFAPR